MGRGIESSLKLPSSKQGLRGPGQSAGPGHQEARTPAGMTLGRFYLSDMGSSCAKQRSKSCHTGQVEDGRCLPPLGCCVAINENGETL